MSNIDTINVGGLDYGVEDSEARSIATGAVNVSAYVENGNTASRAYPTVGTPINWKGSLYYTKATITAGSTLSTATNLTAAANLGAMIRNIKTYVGTDSKIHFTDATGADSVLPFKNSPTITLVRQYTESTGGDIGTITNAMAFYVPAGVKFICISAAANVPTQSVTNASLIGSQYTGSGAVRIGIYESTAEQHTVTGTATTWALTHFVFSIA